MNRPMSLLAIVFLVGLAVSGCGGTAPDVTDNGTPPPEKVRVGYTAPNFSVYTFDSTILTLSNYRGKAVLVNFWATWCGPCRSEVPALIRASNAHKADLVVLGVDEGEDRNALGGWVSSNGITYLTGLDGKKILGSTYGTYGIPTSVFVNRRGIITHIQVGPLSDSNLEGYISDAARS